VTTGTAARSASALPARASFDATLALAAFYGAGGLLCLVPILVPAWAELNQGLVLALGLLATAVAAALPFVRNQVTLRVCYALVMLGSVLIAGLIYAGAGGVASATYDGFYVWVAVYSFVFFSPRAAAVQVLFALITELAALLVLGAGTVAPAQFAVSAGTTVVTGAVVGLLSARLRTLTLTDELTGLPNRRALDLTLHDRLTRHRGRPSVAVLSADLDGFKKLNDTLGHAAGDALLREVAQLWAGVLRKRDVLARMGGDEFIVVLPDCDDVQAQAVAARMVAVVPPPVSACIGLKVVPGGRGALPVDIAQLLADVDAALYEGKSRGPGSVVALPPPPTQAPTAL
jgi:diguanylate cyclase (GGDEF)-like protein